MSTVSVQADFTPTFSETTAPFWDGTRERRLHLQRCDDCGRWVHHPREACPGCLGLQLSWVESSGDGVVHAVSVHHRAFEAMGKDDCPYVVAFIDLDDGVRFLSNIVGDDRELATAGDRVTLDWREVAGGFHLPVFRLAPAMTSRRDRHG